MRKTQIDNVIIQTIAQLVIILSDIALSYEY